MLSYKNSLILNDKGLLIKLLKEKSEKFMSINNFTVF